MKPISLWVTLGMSLFLTLNTEASVVLGNLPDVTYPDNARSRLETKSPTVPTHTQRGIFVPTDPIAFEKRTIRTTSPFGTQPQQIPEPDLTNQNHLEPATINLIWGSGDGDPTDNK